MRCLIILILLVLSCNTSQKQNGFEVKITDSLLLKLIEKYSNCIDQKNQTRDAITVFFKNIKDTVSISLMNSLPDTNIAKLIGSTKLNNSILFFVGDYTLNPFFIISNHYSEVIEPKQKKINKDLLMNTPITEPILWNFKFKNGKMVKFEPVAEITFAIKNS